jgi:hypothetical protein
MSDLVLEDANNTAEGTTGLQATSPQSGDFVGPCILKVGPNLGGNRTPRHFVDGFQGISSGSGGRGVVGQAIEDFPGVSGEGRIGVLGTGDSSGIVGLAGFRKAGPTFPFLPTTVVFPGDPAGTPNDAQIPPGSTIFALPNSVGVLNAGVAGIARDENRSPSPHAGVLGLNLGGGDGVVGQSPNGRGGVFSSATQAQLRLVPYQVLVDQLGLPILPGSGEAGDLIAVTVINSDGNPVLSLWVCTQGQGQNSIAVWQQVTLGVATSGAFSVPIDLADLLAFNRVGIVTDGTRFSGGLDNDGFAYSADLLASPPIKPPFQLGPANKPNVVSATGNIIPLPAGNFSSLRMLATAVNGNQGGGRLGPTFTVTYTDLSTSTFTQSISDWFTPQSFPGEYSAATLAYRNSGNGTRDNRTFFLYGYSFKLDNNKTALSITLPNNPNVEVLALTLVS